MAPDLNSVPDSPRSQRNSVSSTTRRNLDTMAPPPLPPASPASALPNPSANSSAIENGPGPLRHPRPLTAADLHMQLEKEQEAVVNRLTRELSLLRQQTASVASTASSTSTGLLDATDHTTNHLVSSHVHPTSSRRHRSSSSLSTRSVNTAATTASGYTGLSGSTVGTTGGVAGSTFSGIAPARDNNAVPRSSNTRETLSRNGSIASRRSGASSPSLASSLQQADPIPNLYPHRLSNAPVPSQPTMSPGSNRSSYAPTARYEEATHYRSELEIVKRENESLRRRVKELERSLNRRRRSDTAAERSDAGQEDEVHVGESAGSVGLGGGR